jgi:hypothetical protein
VFQFAIQQSHQRHDRQALILHRLPKANAIRRQNAATNADHHGDELENQDAP